MNPVNCYHWHKQPETKVVNAQLDKIVLGALTQKSMHCFQIVMALKAALIATQKRLRQVGVVAAAATLVIFTAPGSKGDEVGFPNTTFDSNAFRELIASLPLPITLTQLAKYKQEPAHVIPCLQNWLEKERSFVEHKGFFGGTDVNDKKQKELTIFRAKVIAALQVLTDGKPDDTSRRVLRECAANEFDNCNRERAKFVLYSWGETGLITKQLEELIYQTKSNEHSLQAIAWHELTYYYNGMGDHWSDANYSYDQLLKIYPIAMRQKNAEADKKNLNPLSLDPHRLIVIDICSACGPDSERLADFRKTRMDRWKDNPITSPLNFPEIEGLVKEYKSKLLARDYRGALSELQRIRRLEPQVAFIAGLHVMLNVQVYGDDASSLELATEFGKLIATEAVKNPTEARRTLSTFISIPDEQDLIEKAYAAGLQMASRRMPDEHAPGSTILGNVALQDLKDGWDRVQRARTAVNQRDWSSASEHYRRLYLLLKDSAYRKEGSCLAPLMALAHGEAELLLGHVGTAEGVLREAGADSIVNSTRSQLARWRQVADSLKGSPIDIELIQGRGTFQPALPVTGARPNDSFFQSQWNQDMWNATVHSVSNGW